MKLIRSSGIYRFYFGVDSDYEETWPYKYGAVIRVRGFGLWRALDAAFLEAFKDGCTAFLRTDAHIYFPHGIKTAGTDLEMAYHCTPEDCYGATYPDPVTYENNQTWGHALLPQTTEPVLFFSRRLVEYLLKRFGCVFCTEFWGAEGYNATLTPCRLGIDCVKTNSTVAIHYYKKDWPKKRVEERRAYEEEPWVREVTENPYFAAIQLSFQIHLARHYTNPAVSTRYNPYYFSLAKKYFSQRMVYIEGADVFRLYAERKIIYR